MAKSSILDDLIASYEPPEYVRAPGGGKVDQVLNSLSARGFDECEKLVDFLLRDINELPNPKAYEFLSEVAAAYDVGMRGITLKNLGEWRNKRRAKR